MLEVVLKEWQGSSQVSGIKCSLEAENVSSYTRNSLEAAWLVQKVAVREQREADEAELVEIKCRDTSQAHRSQRPTTNIFMQVNLLWLYRPQLK